MKRIYRTTLVCLLLIFFSTPVWATGNAHDPNHFDKLKERIHQMLVNHQFWSLKRLYDRSDSDARRLFLNYLGTAAPSGQDQSQALREEYESRIADLNATIASYRQQIEGLSTEKALCDAALAHSEQVHQQLTGELTAAHLMELEQLEAQCDDRVTQARLECEAAPGEPCPASGLLSMTSDFYIRPVYPHALDTDNAGNIFVLDDFNLSITKFDPNGTQTRKWTNADFGGTLTSPVDIALDSQGSVFVLDQGSMPLRKIGPDGQVVPFAAESIVFPSGLYIDGRDRIYVADNGDGAFGGRILVLDSSGRLLRVFGEVEALQYINYQDIVVDEQRAVIHLLAGDMVATFDMEGNYRGSWPGDFYNPNGIAVAANGDIIISDTDADIIDVYDVAGSYRYSYANDFFRPHRICTDSAGKLYVADYRNMKLKIYE